MRIAAIDLGTNSLHLLVVEARPGGSFVPLLREKEMLRLGDGVARHGRIDPDKARQAVDTMRRFRALAENAGASVVVACATSAFREADNGHWLIGAIEDATGISARIIGGQEEAGLIYSAIRASVLVGPSSVLGFDLGGGSLEIMVGNASDLQWATSLPLGVARLAAELVRHGRLTSGDVRRLRKRMVTLLDPVVSELAGRFAPSCHGLVVGSGGTFCALARMLAHRRTGVLPVSVNQLAFTRGELLELHEDLLRMGTADRRRLPGLEGRRADLVPVGSTLLATGMELFGFEEVTISEWALREGIVLETLRAAGAASQGERNIRRASVVALAQRCNWEETHARQVARLALDIFGGTRRMHRMGPADEELLEYAALLHDIGDHVSVHGRHKHTSYLIQHGGLRGFAPEEVATLAALARYGTRGQPKASHEPFGSLPRKERERVVKLAAILRVAAALDRGRAQAVDAIEVEATGSRVRIRLAAGRNCDVELWAADREGEPFERAVGRRLELVATGSRRPSGRGNRAGSAGHEFSSGRRPEDDGPREFAGAAQG